MTAEAGQSRSGTRNAIVLAVGDRRYAVELRWVHEVITLGPMTRVPGAPDHIAGVVNVRGAITPVLELRAAAVGAGRTRAAADRARPVRAGDGAVLVEVDGIAAALRMDAVEEVSSVTERDGADSRAAVGAGAGAVVAAVADSRGRLAGLIDPARLMAIAQSAALIMAAHGHGSTATGAGDGTRDPQG
ncbi:MAG: chemotaxis protein CheW [Myxococcota bacterium]